MIKNVLCIFCKDIIEDARTKMISFINCIDEIVVQKLPIKLPELNFGSTWIKDSMEEENLKVRIRLIHPEGKEKIILETQGEKVTKKHHRINCAIAGLPIENIGTYKFILDQNINDAWKEVGGAVFSVRKA